MQVGNLIVRNAAGKFRQADINSSYGAAFGVNKSCGDRAITAGGAPGPAVNEIEYCSIGHLTNGVDFGDLTSAVSHGAASSNGTRAIVHMGSNGSGETDFFNILTPGNALGFGTSLDQNGTGSGSDGNKMCIWGSTNIEQLTIGSQATSQDFGELGDDKIYRHGGDGDGTYACTVGGYPATDNIELVSFVSSGTAAEYGAELAVSGYGMNHCTDGNRQLRMGAISFTATIDVFVIAQGATVSDFGDLTETAGDFDTGASDGSRGFCGKGNYDPTADTQLYVNIGVFGNAVDFSEGLTATYMSMSTSGG